MTRLFDADDPENGKHRDYTFDYSFWSHDEFEIDERGYFVYASIYSGPPRINTQTNNWSLKKWESKFLITPGKVTTVASLPMDKLEPASPTQWSVMAPIKYLC